MSLDSSLHSESSSTLAVDSPVSDDENLVSDGETSKPSKKIKKQQPEIDFVKLADYWNEKMQGKQIPSIQNVTQKRKTTIMARLSEYGKEAIMRVIDKAAASAFLNGASDRAWVADFDWVMRPNNFPKVLEGNYDDHKPSGQSGTKGREQRMNDAVAIMASLAAKERHDARRSSPVTAMSGADYEGDF